MHATAMNKDGTCLVQGQPVNTSDNQTMLSNLIYPIYRPRLGGVGTVSSQTTNLLLPLCLSYGLPIYLFGTRTLRSLASCATQHCPTRITTTSEPTLSGDLVAERGGC